MKKKLALMTVSACLILAGSPANAEEAHVGPVRDYIKANIEPWLGDAAILEAVKAQNAANAGLSEDDIIGLDKQWRAEVEASDRKLIDAVLGNTLSAFLRDKQQASDGMITEMFVMDSKGLNVGQSDVTSDYWQGDEAKFEKSFGAGTGALFVDEAEKDESTQMLQSQASITISDEAGNPIGAITVGVNLNAL